MLLKLFLNTEKKVFICRAKSRKARIVATRSRKDTFIFSLSEYIHAKVKI